MVTTKTRMYTMPLLEHFDIAQFFEIVTGRENVQNPKPHPEPILITLEQMNYDKNIDSVWMIGDTKLDLIAANEANVNSIGVLCGYGNEKELREYTDFVPASYTNTVRNRGVLAGVHYLVVHRYLNASITAVLEDIEREYSVANEKLFFQLNKTN